MRAVVAAHVGGAAPVGSRTLASLLPVNLSSASIRNTMAQLAALGLVEKPHPSAGRVPTEAGLRLFVNELLDTAALVDYERRTLSDTVDDAEGGELMRVASRLLSERTRQLGFALAPRLYRVILRHLSLVRLSTDRVLVVVIARTGVSRQRVIHDTEASQAELDHIARTLNDRLEGRTLRELREALVDEARALRRHAGRILRRALEIGAALIEDEGDPSELVISSRLALLDQPEFQDPERVRELFHAIETHEDLVSYLDRMLAEPGVCVVFGSETGEPALRHCALVTATYGLPEAPLGRLGVLGPSRMDYARIIPLVEYLSELVTAKLAA